MPSAIELVGLLGSLASMIALTEQSAGFLGSVQKRSHESGPVMAGLTPKSIVTGSRKIGQSQAQHAKLEAISQLPSASIGVLVAQAKKLDEKAAKDLQAAFPDTFRMKRIAQELRASLCELFSTLQTLTGGTLPSPLGQQWAKLGC